MRPSTRIGWFVVIFGAFAASSTQSAERPNILLILADDVGREVLGCYGGTSYKTPNIDRLAADGIRYEHAYVMPVCHPTRITLLTGQYPFRLSHPEWGSFPRTVEKRTLSALLKASGYATAVAGKWQLTLLKDDLEQPHRMGFDEYCLYGWHEGPWYYEPHIWQNGTLRNDVRDRYGPDVICEYLIDFIERNKDRPFFAFYSMSLCHAETNDLEEPAPVGPNGRYDSYAEMVVKMDDRVGRVVNTLDRSGVRKKTLVMFLTDNGTAARNLIDAENGEYVYEEVVSTIGSREIPGGKGTLTDRGTRVPLIINRPEAIQAGQVCNDLTDVSDVLPSLLAVAGVETPTEIELDGQPLPALMRDDVPPRRWVFAEHKGSCFVRNHGWKLYGDGRFYNMNADQEETNPLDQESLSSAATVSRQELQKALDGLDFTAQ
jgi:arylsulfatase A